MKTFNDLKAGDILYVINFGTSIGGMRLEEHKIIATKPDAILDNWLEIITMDGKYHIPPSHTSHEQHYIHHTNIESAKKSYIELAEEELEEAGVDPQEAGLQKLDIRDMSELDEDTARKAELKHEQQKPQAKQKAPVLDPIKFVDLNDVFAYVPELITAGIDEVSIEVGKYLAYVNAGLTNEQAYELITIESKRQHELEMANKQLELERIKVEAQLRAGGIKQLLNR